VIGDIGTKYMIAPYIRCDSEGKTELRRDDILQYKYIVDKVLTGREG